MLDFDVCEDLRALVDGLTGREECALQRLHCLLCGERVPGADHRHLLPCRENALQALGEVLTLGLPIEPVARILGFSDAKMLRKAIGTMPEQVCISRN